MTAGAPGAVARVAGAISPWPGPALVLLGPARKGRVLIPVWAGWLRKSARMQKVLEEQQWSRENRRSGPFEEVLSRLLLSGVRKLRKVSNCGSRSRSENRSVCCNLKARVSTPACRSEIPMPISRTRPGPCGHGRTGPVGQSPSHCTGALRMERAADFRTPRRYRNRCYPQVSIQKPQDRSWSHDGCHCPAVSAEKQAQQL